MKRFCKLCCILLFASEAISLSNAEVLGRMSDETDQLAEPAPLGTKQNNQQIIYRVICPEGTEVLPECEQAPVFDALDTPAVAKAVSNAENANESSEKATAPAAQSLAKSKSTKSVKGKKSVADKKHAKKGAAKTAAKTAKRKHR